MSINKRLINRFWWEVSQAKVRRWSMYSNKSKISGYIVMYHYISDEHIPNMLENCQCTISEFKRSLDYLRNQGYSFVSIDEAINIINNKSAKKYAVITFDDIPDFVYTNAYPILKQQNIPFTIYITFNFIGKVQFVTKEHLLELNADPLCTIGAHTMNHTVLRKDSNARDEIKDSKVCLEKLLRKKVEHFAYPYGQLSAVSRRNVAMAKAAGYKSAVSALCAPVTEASAKNQWFLPRIVIDTLNI